MKADPKSLADGEAHDRERAKSLAAQAEALRGGPLQAFPPEGARAAAYARQDAERHAPQARDPRLTAIRERVKARGVVDRQRVERIRADAAEAAERAARAVEAHEAAAGVWRLELTAEDERRAKAAKAKGT